MSYFINQYLHQLEVEDFVGLAFRLLLSLVCVSRSTTVLIIIIITKRAVKGQRAGMSNGSKSVNDGFLGRDEEQSEKENMQIESCIAFSQLHNHFMFLILGFF